MEGQWYSHHHLSCSLPHPRETPPEPHPCHIPEGHHQSPIPELRSWDQLRPYMGNYEWIANEESVGLETGGGLP